MRTENGVSMLEYVRQAIEVWGRHPVLLTVPLVATSWLSSTLYWYIHRGPSRRHTLPDIFDFLLTGLTFYLAHMFLNRIVSDVLEGVPLDVRAALRQCLRLKTFSTAAGLYARFVLWVLVGFVAGAVFLLVGRVVTHQTGVHGALSKPFAWVVLLTTAIFVTRYDFAVPYLAFSRGDIAKPISLSVTRTRPILRSLMWLTVSGTVFVLAMSQIGRTVSAHLAVRPVAQLELDLLGDAIRSVPSVWAAIAVTLIAYQDWVAMKAGGGLVTVEKREIELIDGLPAYLPVERRPSNGGF